MPYYTYMDIFEGVRQLKLPDDSYVIVGGGLLVALGLLEWDEDIDICVTPEVFAALEQQGWERHRFQDKTVLKHGIYDVGMGFGKWSLADLAADAEHIQGIPFISLTKLRQWKTAMNRPKDQIHVRLIDDYLKRQRSHG